MKWLVVLDSQPVEGKSKGKTIAERAAIHFSKYEEEPRDEKEDYKVEIDKEDYGINNVFVDNASLTSTSSYNSQTIDNCSEEASCLAIDFGNSNNDELEIEPCYESCDTNVIQEVPLEKGEAPTPEEDIHDEELIELEDAVG